MCLKKEEEEEEEAERGVEEGELCKSEKVNVCDCAEK